MTFEECAEMWEQKCFELRAENLRLRAALKYYVEYVAEETGEGAAAYGREVLEQK